jgi:RNA-directed DNA polymerase
VRLPPATHLIVGFEYREDAERFLAELRDRLAQFCLELAAEKTRLIEFGRFAAEHRQQRGFGKPETFGFLGFTHICTKDRRGRFALRRATDKKRLRPLAIQSVPFWTGSPGFGRCCV